MEPRFIPRVSASVWHLHTRKRLSLSPYCSYLSPIESYFAEVKAAIRRYGQRDSVEEIIRAKPIADRSKPFAALCAHHGYFTDVLPPVKMSMRKQDLLTLRDCPLECKLAVLVALRGIAISGA